MAARRWIVAYLATQALLAVAYWVALLGWPDTRAWFLPAGWPEHVLLAFWLPDLCFLLVGSALGAIFVARRRESASIALWLVLGAVACSTLWCVAASLHSGSGWLATGLMAASTAGTLVCALAHRRLP